MRSQTLSDTIIAGAKYVSKSESPARFQVVAFKPSGRRIVVGNCPTHDAAESGAALLRRYSRPIGGDTIVQAVESA